MKKLTTLMKFFLIALAIIFASSNGYSQCMDYTITNVSCNGGADGSVTITINNGQPPYNFSIFGTKFLPKSVSSQVSNIYTFTGLPADDIFIVTQFSSGPIFVSCPPIFATITESPIILINESITQNTCNGGNIGAIDLTINGGTAPYGNFLWNDPASSTTEDISGLSAGSYTVTFTDANSCPGTATFNLVDPLPFTVTPAITNVGCAGGSDGAIDISISGGTSPYGNFSWNDPANSSTEDISGLSAGSYTVTFTDANGCPGAALFNVVEPMPFTITPAITNVTCNSGNDGAIDITISGGTAPFGNFLWNDPAASTTEDISGLGAGSYTVTFTDANACPGNATYNIVEPLPFTITPAITNVTCNAGSDGAINITISGGSAPYGNFSWNDPANSITEDIAGLSAGSYTVTFTDANGCPGNATFNIVEPLPFNITPSITDVVCNGGSNGAIDISISNGAAPYGNFAWNDPASTITEDISGLSAGSYTVTFTDANSCPGNATFNVTEPLPFTVTPTIASVGCTGDSDGAIDISISGGTAPYGNFSWNDPANSITEDISGLSAGSYTVTFTDANNCPGTATFNVVEPMPFIITPSITDVACNGGSNGAIDITISNGIAPYGNFLWNDPAASTTEDISGLNAGSYTVTFTDVNACPGSATFNIVEPLPFTITPAITDAACNGGSNGAIDITISGGSAPYGNFSWNDPANSSTEDISGLSAGSYTVNFTDANACPGGATFNIVEPMPFTVTPAITNVTCNGGSDGAIDITISNGVAPYGSFAWNDPAASTTEDISGLSAGSYTVTFTDVNACPGSATFNIAEPLPFIITPIITDVTCNGGSNGAIDITISNGLAPYGNFVWNNPAASTTEDISGLSAGSYTVTFTDANNCPGTATFNVVEPIPFIITPSITDVACNGGSNGAIDITISNGIAPYGNFLWNNPAASTTEDISGLSAGSYTVTFTDANNCPGSATYNIVEPLPFTITPSISDAICNGGSNGAIDITISGGSAPYGNFSWNDPANSSTEDISGLSAGSYTVNFTDANACPGSATFNIVEPMPFTVTPTITNVTCNGGNDGAIDITISGGSAPYGTFAWSDPAASTTEDISGLSAGSYTVNFTDVNACPGSATFNIVEPLPFIITPIITDVTCNGGSNGTIDITISNGLAPYGNFVWNNPASSTTEDISGLSAGSYIVTFTDANNCPGTAAFNIVEPLPLTISPAISNVSCNGGGSDGAIDISISGGSAPYGNFLWNDPAASATEDISGLSVGSYTVTFTDANNCPGTATFNVDVSLPFTFTPVITDLRCNGDSDGAIDITIGGGTAPYGNFSWNDPAASSTEDISGLSAGSYTINFTDASGCPGNATFNVVEPLPYTITPAITDVSCNGGSDGAINITISGGTAPYENFIWNNPATSISEDILSLSAGTYMINFTDANACPGTATFNVNEPLPFTITPVITDVACNGGSDGEIEITIGNGTAPYDNFAWNDPAASITEDISGLSAGSYTITFTDANSCPGTRTFSVIAPDAIDINGNPTDATCLGINNGGIDIMATGGTGAGTYTYAWSNGSVTEDIGSLAPGTYSVTVTDGNNCTSSANFDINPGLELDLTIAINHVVCNAGLDGSVDITNVSGGTAPYSYLWSHNGSTSQNISALAAADYTVRVTDTDGCAQDSTITITEPPVLDLSATFDTPICSYGNNGEVVLTATGGSGSFTYSNDNLTYAGTNVFSGLNPGTYKYYTRDNNMCIDSVDAVLNSFPEVDIPSITESLVNLKCNGVNTGEIHLFNITGGVRPYEFSLNGGTPQSDSSFISLGAATHTINISDANGCTYPYNFTIIQPDPIDLILTFISPETCNNQDGEFRLSVISGGQSPYKYSFSGPGFNGPQINYPASNPVIPFTNLSSAIYSITVIDDSAPGCSLTKSIAIPKKQGPIPYLVIDSTFCHDGSNGRIVVDSLSGGVPLFDITIGEIDSVYSATQTGVGSNDTRSFHFLSYGYYSMTIQDQECTYATNMYYQYNGTDYDTIYSNAIFVPQPTPISAQVSVLNTDRYLNTGSATIQNVLGGSPPYYYSTDFTTWNFATDTILISSLSKGSHTLYIRDDNMCVLTLTFTIDAGFFIPNLISPNNDNHNDLFEIVGLPYGSEIRISNRWGSRVYYNKNYDNSWDGSNEPDGVYFYELVLSNNKVYKGWIEIIR